MTSEERELDRLWRERFGQPLPILGAPEVVREVLELIHPMKGDACRELRPSV